MKTKPRCTYTYRDHNIHANEINMEEQDNSNVTPKKRARSVRSPVQSHSLKSPPPKSQRKEQPSKHLIFDTHSTTVSNSYIDEYNRQIHENGLLITNKFNEMQNQISYQQNLIKQMKLELKLQAYEHEQSISEQFTLQSAENTKVDHLKGMVETLTNANQNMMIKSDEMHTTIKTLMCIHVPRLKMKHDLVRYSDEVINTLADLHSLNNVSFNKCGGTISTVSHLFKNVVPDDQVPSKSTSVRSVIAKAIGMDMSFIVPLLERSRDLGVMVDGTTTSGIYHTAILFYGYDDELQDTWIIPVRVLTLSSHTGEQTARFIKETIETYTGYMKKSGSKNVKRLYHFVQLTVDNASDQRGKFSGCDKILQQLRLDCANNHIVNIHPLVTHGCKDHIMNLVDAEGSIITFLQRTYPSLCPSPDVNIFKVIRWIYNRIRTHHKPDWMVAEGGFLHDITSNRYNSLYNACSLLSLNRNKIISLLDRDFSSDKKTQNQIEANLRMFKLPDVGFLLLCFQCVGSINKSHMKMSNNSNTLKGYMRYIRALVETVQNIRDGLNSSDVGLVVESWKQFYNYDSHERESEEKCALDSEMQCTDTIRHNHKVVVVTLLLDSWLTKVKKHDDFFICGKLPDPIAVNVHSQETIPLPEHIVCTTRRVEQTLGMMNHLLVSNCKTRDVVLTSDLKLRFYVRMYKRSYNWLVSRTDKERVQDRSNARKQYDSEKSKLVYYKELVRIKELKKQKHEENVAKLQVSQGLSKRLNDIGYTLRSAQGNLTVPVLKAFCSLNRLYVPCTFVKTDIEKLITTYLEVRDLL